MGVHIRSDTGLYKRVLDALSMQVTSGVPYPHTSNPLCEAHNRLVEQILRMLMKQERTKDWVHLLPCDVLTMNSPQRSSTGYSPHDLFHWGRSAWLFKIFLTLRITIVGDWLEHKQDLANFGTANLKYVRERELTRRNRARCPATLKVRRPGLVQHLPLLLWPRNCLQDPFRDTS